MGDEEVEKKLIKDGLLAVALAGLVTRFPLRARWDCGHAYLGGWVRDAVFAGEYPLYLYVITPPGEPGGFSGDAQPVGSR